MIPSNISDIAMNVNSRRLKIWRDNGSVLKTGIRIVGGGVQLGPLGTLTTNWLILLYLPRVITRMENLVEY
jgi:hypothetical protein